MCTAHVHLGMSVCPALLIISLHTVIECLDGHIVDTLNLIAKYESYLHLL